MQLATAQVLGDIRVIINDIPDVKAREGALQDTINTLRAQQQTSQEDTDAMTLARDKLADDKKGLEGEVGTVRERVIQLEAEKAEVEESRAGVDEELREEKAKSADLEQEKEDMLEELRTLRLELQNHKRKAEQSDVDVQEMEVLIDAAQARDEVSLEERRKMIELGKKRRRIG